MANPIFTYENVKNNKEIRDQWRNYILQKFNDKPNWSLLTQILGDNNTLQIDKLTPESFNTINKIFGTPAIYNDRSIDTTPLRPPLMQKSEQQTPDNNNDAIPNNQKDFAPAVGISNEGAKPQHVSVEPATQNDKTGKPVVVTDGQPSNGNPSKKTIGWSSGNGYMYDPSIRLNNNVQYVINTLKTYGYPQQVLDSFKQDIDKILANTKDNNRIDTANKYIDQFLGDKQDLRMVPGKPALDQPAPNQQPQKAGNKNKSGKKPRMSDDEIDAFLKEELGGNTYASPGVPKGGTKTIGYDPYDPNPGNVSLAYAMRNAPEQERRAALINKWNQENRSGSTYASPGINTGGTYATGEGIKDANGNVLTNPGGDWEYQYALKNPQYGLGMMGKMSDAQRNYLQAVSDDMGYNYNFTGATRFV